jgi:hypothetical protein
MRRVHPASVLLGVLVDKLTFVAIAVALASALGVSSPSFQILVMPVGFCAIGLGGFAAAWNARCEEPRHGLAVGVVGTAISFARFVVNTLWPPAEAAALHPLWWELLGWASAPVAGLIGGWLAHAPARRSLRGPPRTPGSWVPWIPAYLAVIGLFAFAEQF